MAIISSFVHRSQSGFILFFLLLFFAFEGSSQAQKAPYIAWEKTYGGYGTDQVNSILPTLDGGYIISGEIIFSTGGDIQSGFHGVRDGWVIKIDQEGNLEWERAFGGSEQDYFKSSYLTSENDIILVGNTCSNDGDIQSGLKGICDAWVVKINSQGNILWEKTYGGSAVDFLNTIQSTPDGGFLLGGLTSSADGDISSGTPGDRRFMVLKIDDQGNLIWESTFGGSGEEEIYSTVSSEDGGYLLTGYTYSNDGDVTGDKGGTDVWIIKIDKEGKLLWEKVYGGSMLEAANTVLSLPDGGFIVSATTMSNDGDIKSGNAGDYDAWVFKINSEGIIEWENTYGRYGDDRVSSLLAAPDGGFVIVGTENFYNLEEYGAYEIWVFKIDQIGNLLWEKTFGGTGEERDNLNSSATSLEGDFIIGGLTNSVDGDVQSGNKGGDDYWVFKLEENNFPTNIELSKQTISENLPINAEVGVLSTIDMDSEENFVYSLALGEGGIDNSSFAIIDNRLITSEVFNFDVKNTYSIRIRSEDKNGGFFAKAFTILIEEDEDGDGIKDGLDLCPGTTSGETVDNNGCLVLSADNFEIRSSGETCPDKNNGQINVFANKILNYSLSINGVNHQFTNDIKLDNLSPGTYELCINIPNTLSPQCFNVKISEGKTVSGQSFIKGSELSVNIETGTSPFSVSVNGFRQFQTNSTTFSLKVNEGDLVEISSNITCEGIISKIIEKKESVVLYPNPTTGIFTISVPAKQEKVEIELYSVYSQLISTAEYEIRSGNIRIDLTKKPSGIYFVKLLLDQPVTKKIIKE